MLQFLVVDLFERQCIVRATDHLPAFRSPFVVVDATLLPNLLNLPARREVFLQEGRVEFGHKIKEGRMAQGIRAFRLAGEHPLSFGLSKYGFGARG